MSGSRKESERTKFIQEKCQTLLTSMLRDEDNKYCVDCDSKGDLYMIEINFFMNDNVIEKFGRSICVAFEEFVSFIDLSSICALSVDLIFIPSGLLNIFFLFFSQW